MILPSLIFTIFFFNDTATTEIYTLSLHDALPIFLLLVGAAQVPADTGGYWQQRVAYRITAALDRSEEHTSELQSRSDLVCRLLLEKKKKPGNFGSSAHIYKEYLRLSYHVHSPRHD